METYDVYKVEEQTTKTGKQVKKLVLQKEGAQYPLKNVSMWSDHPQYASVAPGQQLTCEIYESDSGVPNPKAPGKNYINRTVSNPNGNTSPAPKAAPTGDVATKADIASLRADLKIIADHLGVEPPKPTVGNTDIPYPEGPEGEPFPDEEIKPEDIPF